MILDELDEYLGKYAKMFGDGFPMFQIGQGRTDAEIIGIIKECLDSNKDAYELGYVSDDLDIVY